MKIAITGGSGFIGSRLVKELSKKHDVTVLDVIDRVTDLGVNFKKVDITSIKQVDSAMKDGYDVVYHLAGTVVDQVRKDPYKALTLNITGTQNVLETCRVNNVGKIIFASTFYVYDGLDENIIVNEYTPLDVSRMELFGAIKYFCESMVRTYSEKFGIDYNILRFGSAYGADERCSNVILTFLNMALNGETIDVWGKGRRRNQYTYVDDLVEGCVSVINKKNEIYNLVSPEETTTANLAKLIEGLLDAKFVFLKEKPEGPSMPYISSRKAIRELGWKSTPLREGIKKTIEELRHEK
jgi:UDP-glucose 4-epimerase